MASSRLLTTTQAARIASVAPSTIKRWADEGRLAYVRTPGGHRRFERANVEGLLRPTEPTTTSDEVSGWLAPLLRGDQYAVDRRLQSARARLGSWYAVADELGAVIESVGQRWQCGDLSIAEEHMVSEGLARALSRMSDTLPPGLHGPTCVLVCACADEHTLGLRLAELCARELGWRPLWLGRRTPVPEIIRVLDTHKVAVVAMSASAWSQDAGALRATAAELSEACQARGVQLVLGGAGDWPDSLPDAVRLRKFSAFSAHLAGVHQADATARRDDGPA